MERLSPVGDCAYPECCMQDYADTLTATGLPVKTAGDRPR
jgi:hypothetical protein